MTEDCVTLLGFAPAPTAPPPGYGVAGAGPVSAILDRAPHPPAARAHPVIAAVALAEACPGFLPLVPRRLPRRQVLDYAEARAEAILAEADRLCDLWESVLCWSLHPPPAPKAGPRDGRHWLAMQAERRTARASDAKTLKETAARLAEARPKGLVASSVAGHANGVDLSVLHHRSEAGLVPALLAAAPGRPPDTVLGPYPPFGFVELQGPE